MGRENNNQNKFKQYVTGIGKGILYFSVTLGILFVLFVFSCCIPKEKIKENLLVSAEYLLAEEELFHQLKEGDRRTEIHNYADATTLNILYSMDREDLLWNLAMSPFYSDGMDLTRSVTELLQERIVQEREADTVYDRYWHGMILILKPLFLLFTVQQIRWIFLGILVTGMLVLTLLLIQRKQYLMSVLLWLGALAVQFWMAGLCIEYFPVFLIAICVSIATVLKEENRSRICHLCIVSGVCVAFFDFLTTETLAFVLPLVVVYGIWQSKGSLRSIKEEVWFLIKAGSNWLGAYVFTYLAKWTLASAVCGEERFSVALMQLAGRQGNSVTNLAVETNLPQFLSAVLINIRLLLGLDGTMRLDKLLFVLLATGLILAVFVYLFRKPGRVETFSVLLWLLGTIPMFRMMVLNNHSIEHCFFVYRSLYGTIVCYAAGFLNVIDWEFLRRRKKHGITRTKKQR